MAQTEVLPALTKPKVGRTGDPCVMVIFGFSGDLTRRKLIPALYNLASQQLLSREFAVIGVGRSPMSDDDARKKVTEDFKQFATGTIDQDLWEWFVRRISYISGDFDDPATYDRLKDALGKSTRNTIRMATISSISPPLPTTSATSSSGWPRSA